MSRNYSIKTGIMIVVVLLVSVFLVKHFQSQKTGAVKTEARLLGPDHAAIKILEYSDFQCPACRKAQTVLKQLIEKYPREVQINFKHFPLAMHKWAPLAHQAAECAHQAGKFWEYHDRLYEDQENWSKLENPSGQFAIYATKLGLDADAFVACLQNPKITEMINKERAEGQAVKVQSTPTFFIGNDRFVGAKGLTQAEVKIKDLIEKDRKNHGL